MSATCPHCGADLTAHVLSSKETKVRSYPQLQRHHVIVRGAYDQWPEAHDFRPKSPDHLRYWLYCQTDNCEVVKTIDCTRFELPPEQLQVVLTAALTVALRCSDDEKMFVEMDGPLIVVKKANGASYAALRHMAACKAFDAVDEFLCVELGIESVELLLERAA